MYQISPKVAMIDVGMAMAAMIVERKLAEEQQHDERGEDRADDQVLLDVVDRRLDELRLVAHDPDVVARRQRRARARRAARAPPSTTSTVFVPDWRRICSSTVLAPLTLATRFGIGLAVLDLRDVGDPDRVAVLSRGRRCR